MINTDKYMIRTYIFIYGNVLFLKLSNNSVIRINFFLHNFLHDLRFSLILSFQDLIFINHHSYAIDGYVIDS